MSKVCTNFFTENIICKKCKKNEFMITHREKLIEIVCCNCFASELLGYYYNEDSINDINFRYHTDSPQVE